MNHASGRSRRFLSLVLIATIPELDAQTAPASPPAATGQEDTVVLSPFQVTENSDMGYQATQSLAGTRLNSNLKDIATQVDVMTPEFISDLSLGTLDTAFRYSLNAENKYEDGIGNLTDTSNSIFGGRGRTRGINAGSANRTQNFFDTSMRFDSYNVERFTFASGPNSILFGNSAAVGTIDTTFKRALLDRKVFSVQTRVDNWASTRVSTDLNVPIIKNKLALRIDGLNDRTNDWRKPGFYDQDRLYAALTIAPVKWLTIRAYNETEKEYKNPVLNGLMQDHVTPWINQEKPAFDNGGGLTAAFPTIPGNLTGTVGSVFQRMAAATGGKPVFQFDAGGPIGIVDQANNQVYTRGYDTLIAPPDNLERNIMDQSIYPWNRNFSGNVNQTRIYAYVRSLVVEANPVKNLFFEAGINQEHNRFRGVSFFNSGQEELAVDANRFLQDRVTPNPNYGRYFFDTLGSNIAPVVGKGFIAKEEKRASVSYDLNFTERKGWMKWLGHHRAAYMLNRAQTTSIQNQNPLQIVGSNYSFWNGNTFANRGQPAFRYYIDPSKGSWTVNLPFDPMQDGKFTLPGWKDANGQQVYLASWDTDPEDQATPTNTVGKVGVGGFGSLSRQQINSRTIATQSWLWGDRIVFSYGVRRDDVAIQSTPAGAVVGDPDFNRISVNNNKLPWTTARTNAPHNRLKSFVVRPFNWLGFFWSESQSQISGSLLNRNLTGEPVLGTKGLGRDYGITLSWKNLISLRVNKFYNAGAHLIASTGDASTGTGTSPGLDTSLIKTTVASFERTVQMTSPTFNPANPTAVDPSLLLPQYAFYQQDLAVLMPDGTGAGSANLTNLYRVFSDQVAKGYEATLVGNPSPRWRISISGARTDVAESNIGQQYLDFIQARLPVWTSAQYIDKVIPQSGTSLLTIRQALPSALLNWNFIRMANGRPQPSPRYRYNFLTRYSFDRGAMKGAFMGADLVYRTPGVVGFPTTTTKDNPFVVPGVASGSITVVDVNHPLYGNKIISFDPFFGYQRRLFENKVLWLVQLNIRNVLDRDEPVLVQSYSNGQPAFYRSTEPRTFILTSTFTF